jgi:hypothetical protein
MAFIGIGGLLSTYLLYLLLGAMTPPSSGFIQPFAQLTEGPQRRGLESGSLPHPPASVPCRHTCAVSRLMASSAWGSRGRGCSVGTNAPTLLRRCGFLSFGSSTIGIRGHLSRVSAGTHSNEDTEAICTFLQGLRRADLQALAKENNVPANKKSADIIAVDTTLAAKQSCSFSDSVRGTH